MTKPDTGRVTRETAAFAQNTKLDKLIEAIHEYQEENVRHARTNSAGDYLDLLEIEHRLAKMLSDALHWDTYEQQGIIEDEARCECDYDLVEGCFLDDNGDPRREGSLPPGYSDYVYETRRDAE